MIFCIVRSLSYYFASRRAQVKDHGNTDNLWTLTFLYLCNRRTALIVLLIRKPDLPVPVAATGPLHTFFSCFFAFISLPLLVYSPFSFNAFSFVPSYLIKLSRQLFLASHFDLTNVPLKNAFKSLLKHLSNLINFVFHIFNRKFTIKCWIENEK